MGTKCKTRKKKQPATVVEDKPGLVRDLTRLREGLEADNSEGCCLPSQTYEQLHYSTLDALRFLNKRAMSKGEK